MCSCIISNVCWTSSRLLTEAGQGSPQTCKNRIQLEKKYLELNTHTVCTHHYPCLYMWLYTLHVYDLPGTVCVISGDDVIGDMGNDRRRQGACVKVGSDHVQQIDGNRNRPVERDGGRNNERCFQYVE